MAKHQKAAAGAGAPDASGAGEMPADVAGMRYEAALQELESIIQRIEEGEVELEESLQAYRRGDWLLRRCRALLDAAEQQVKHVTGKDLPAQAGREEPPDAREEAPF